MKSILYFIFFLFLSDTLFSQAPEIQWQKCYGSNVEDNLYQLGYFHSSVKMITRDKKNVLIGGVTDTYTGCCQDGALGWIAKVNLLGTIEWKVDLNVMKSLYLSCAQETSNGDFIVMGFGSDTTFGFGMDDVVITKINNRGTIIWQKYYGGTDSDFSYRIIETKDKGFVLAGYSVSNDGHLSGQSALDVAWYAKIDINGNLIWSKKMGLMNGYTFALGLKEDMQGNILMGYNLDRPLNAIQLIKIRSNGDSVWSKRLDGSGIDVLSDIEQLSANEFILVGHTNSADGDFPNSMGRDPDGFLMSIDSLGNKKWFKRYGGSLDDRIFDLEILPDLSFLIIGFSASQDGDLMNDLPKDSDVWVAKINIQGNIEWSRSYGGTYSEEGYSIGVLSEHEYIFLAKTFSNDFDVSGNHGVTDIWLVKLGNTSKIKVSAFFDTNFNSVKDGGESFADDVKITAEKAGYSKSSLTNGGFSEINVDTGAYNISASFPYYAATPTVSTSTFNTYFLSDSLSFALQPVSGINDLQINLLPMGPARPGFPVSYKIVYKNAGTTIITHPVIKFIKSNKVTLSSTIPSFTTLVADTLMWNLSALNPYDTGSININMIVAASPAVLNGFLLVAYASIDPIHVDTIPEDNIAHLSQTVVGSFDPNDKTEANAGIITPAQVTDGEYLNYLIRFQNTGSDTAFNVIVRDTLDTKLDWNSLQMISCSHVYQLSIKDNDKITWEFNDINLPDSNINEPLSHGYIAYRIKPRNNVILGDTIKNTAGIYFDFNLPVSTNIQTTTVFLASALPVTIKSLDAVLQSGNKVLIQWKTSDEQNVQSYDLQKSEDGINFIYLGTVFSRPGTQNTYSLTDRSPYTGTTYYRLKSIDRDGGYSFSRIVSINLPGNSVLEVSVYPNPTNGEFVIKLNGQSGDDLQIRINDIEGRLLYQKKYVGLNANTVSIPVNDRFFRKGIYLLHIQTGEHTSTQKLIIR